MISTDDFRENDDYAENLQIMDGPGWTEPLDDGEDIEFVKVWACEVDDCDASYDTPNELVWHTLDEHMN